MQFILKPTGKGAWVSAEQTHEDGDWGITIPMKVDDPQSIALATGGDLTKIEGRVSIQCRPLSASKVPFVGEVSYHEAMAADAEIPAFPESFGVLIYATDKVFEDSLRLCAMGHFPNLILKFQDDETGADLEIIKKKPNGLTYADEYIYDDIVWDNKNFRRVSIKSAHVSFPLSEYPALVTDRTESPSDVVSEANPEMTLPATRQQITMLTLMIRNVGLGLGILAIVLHYLK